MVLGMKADPYRLLAAALMFLSALLVAWLAGMAWAHFTPARSAEVEMMHMPGSDKTIPMPPKVMRAEIEQRIRAGTAPTFKLGTPASLKRLCGVRHELLGCTADFGRLGKIILIRDGMSRELTHMAKVHEFAHYYGWKH